ncbi:sigma-70 family RNA polymerase sigma factor [Yoonia sp. BS5-3]|uniref:RNA polymerase sigma factor n=1 Tax=Yoonia phaeophyticola TaxID=3137369 RepID=A0ABZ2V7Y2_9RHOB
MNRIDGDEDPRDEIITHLAQLRAFAVSLTRNPVAADDLVQDTIVKAWKGFHRYQPGTNLRAWLFTILRNTFYSDLRKAQREQVSSENEIAELVTTPDHGDDRIALIDFERALGLLPPEQREALVLVGASGLSYQDAAMTCGVAVGTIKSRINRGRAKLAEILEREVASPSQEG